MLESWIWIQPITKRRASHESWIWILIQIQTLLALQSLGQEVLSWFLVQVSSLSMYCARNDGIFCFLFSDSSKTSARVKLHLRHKAASKASKSLFCESSAGRLAIYYLVPTYSVLSEADYAANSCEYEHAMEGEWPRNNWNGYIRLCCSIKDHGLTPKRNNTGNELQCSAC